MKNFKSLFLVAAILLGTATIVSVVAQDVALEPDTDISAGTDGHGHWHGSIFHCSGTPIDCHNP